jgi:hypothetical protein
VTELPRANVRVFRIVAAAWLIGWFWKAWFFAGYYFAEIWAHPIRYAGLPGALVHPAVAAITWASPVLVIAAIVHPRTWTLRAAAGLMASAAFVACLHFETFSDATFVTSLWVALWLVWFVANARRSDAALYLHARVLAQCTLALVFLGGAVGKLTAEYTSGEAFYHLYIVQKQSWPYPWLRDTVSADALRTIATWFSRGVIGVELALALCPLVPYRLAALGGTAVMLGMVAISTFHLFSVMACLIGLLLALFVVDDATA